MVRLDRMTKGRLLTLTQPVHIEDGHQVVQLVLAGKMQRLPHTALGRLAVSQQTVDAVAGLVEMLRGVGHARSTAQTLAERTGSYVHEFQALQCRLSRKNVTFKFNDCQIFLIIPKPKATQQSERSMYRSPI